MAVLKTGNVQSTQTLPAGSTLIPANQIKSTATASDNYRPISYSDEIKSAAKDMGPAGSYYLWQDDPKAPGSAAWMESELKKRGVDLSSKSNTGNAVADFFIEAGKGIIEIPIGLKRTLSAGAVGAVAVTKQSAGQNVKTLSEGTDTAIKTTVNTAIDNPGRFTGAVVGGIVATKGIGTGLKAIPKPKVTTSKTSTTINAVNGAKGTSKTVTISTKAKTIGLTIQKTKTGNGTQTTRTAGITNNKTGTAKAVQTITNKKTIVQGKDAAINSTLKSRKITVTERGVRTKAVSKQGVIKESAKAKRTEVTISKGGTLKVHGVETTTRTEKISGKSIKKGDESAAKQTIKRIESNKRSLTKNGKTETRKTGSRKRGSKYTLNGMVYDPTAPKVRRPKYKRTKGKKTADNKQTKPGYLGVIGTIKQQPKGKSTAGGGSGSNGSNGMKYKTKTHSKTTQTQNQKPKAKVVYQSANILRGQTKPAQKVRGVPTAKTHQTTKTASKANQQIYKTTEATPKTGNTTANSSDTKRRTKNKTGTKAGAALAVTQARRKTVKQATKQTQKPAQKELRKTAQAVRNKKKHLIRGADYEKRKVKKIKTKKPKSYLRSETRNSLSWITDNSKLMKEKRITK